MRDPKRECTCGCDQFHAHQRVYTDVVVDAQNNFLHGGKPYESENPYGPYTCKDCDKEYEEVTDIPEFIPEKRQTLLTLEIFTSGLSEEKIVTVLNGMMDRALEEDDFAEEGEFNHHEFRIVSKKQDHEF